MNALTYRGESWSVRFEDAVEADEETCEFLHRASLIPEEAAIFVVQSVLLISFNLS